jgi:type VI secretion system secreted protein VgrG
MALTGLAGQLAVTPAASDFEFVAPPDRQGRLRVVSFTARESMSELYSFEVMLCMPRAHDLPPADLEESLLGQPGHLTLGVGEPMERTVRGIVSSVVLEGTSAENRRPCVRLTLVPRLWLTTQKRRSRIFQEMTVREVIDKVLDEWAIPRTWRTLEKMVRRTYCTQYQETDHAFITRLLAEEGIFSGR